MALSKEEVAFLARPFMELLKRIEKGELSYKEGIELIKGFNRRLLSKARAKIIEGESNGQAKNGEKSRLDLVELTEADGSTIPLRKVELEICQAAYRRAGSSITLAARNLKISREKLYRHLKGKFKRGQ